MIVNELGLRTVNNINCLMNRDSDDKWQSGVYNLNTTLHRGSDNKASII